MDTMNASITRTDIASTNTGEPPGRPEHASRHRGDGESSTRRAMNRYQEQFRNFMDARGFHVTRKRMSIAALLFAMPGHHTVDELHDAVRKFRLDIGQATLYRTLKLLVEAGLVLELRLGDRASRFEAVIPQKSHDHLICQRCGAIMEIPRRVFEKLQTPLIRRRGFVLAARSQCLYGLCQDCREREPQGRAPR
ncbi:MAG: transcriptional repressor [Zoogloeaceae bacterium]|nr:transcriptional repressor [Zoogloeaceae bacterium]